MSRPEPKFELELKISHASYSEMESYYRKLLEQAGQVIAWHMHGKRCYLCIGEDVPDSNAVMLKIDEALGYVLPEEKKQ